MRHQLTEAERQKGREAQTRKQRAKGGRWSQRVLRKRGSRAQFTAEERHRGGVAGGRVCLQKRGREWYAELGRRSGEARRRKATS